ncbi:hypothetical protein DAETH_28550 [Deinococcus aetherius]|uniref:Uncharacterized protein n=1 Tax=Deinococcus aetherius TaxID=200252 RepID=A0ABN6RHN1_9DEIO|nr:hypothetical protein DAETH_28550 [Deinococcus aetherius]
MGYLPQGITQGGVPVSGNMDVRAELHRDLQQLVQLWRVCGQAPAPARSVKFAQGANPGRLHEQPCQANDGGRFLARRCGTAAVQEGFGKLLGLFDIAKPCIGRKDIVGQPVGPANRIDDRGKETVCHLIEVSAHASAYTAPTVEDRMAMTAADLEAN